MYLFNFTKNAPDDGYDMICINFSSNSKPLDINYTLEL